MASAIPMADYYGLVDLVLVEKANPHCKSAPIRLSPDNNCSLHPTLMTEFAVS